MGEPRTRHWIERFLTIVLALSLWLPASARACMPADGMNPGCCCCGDRSDDSGASVETKNECCEARLLATPSPATAPEISGWTLDHAELQRVELDIRLPESRHRLHRALARAPPGAELPIYIRNCSYLL